MSIGLHINYPLLSSNFNETWIVSSDFRGKNSSITFHKVLSPNSWVVPCGQDGERVGRQTEHEANSHFSHFANTSNKKWAWRTGQTLAWENHSIEIPVTVPLSPLQIPCRILENHNTTRLYDNIKLHNSVSLNAINKQRKNFISITYTPESGGL